jgi:4a-hydroxytetrahydrobiopterin dehydratase
MAQLTGDIKNKKCIPCEEGTKPLAPEEYEAYLHEELAGWSIADEKFLEKEYKFEDFKAALAFINKVGALSEQEGHHPDILLHGWNHVRLILSTHAIGGLSENDFILASKVDSL